MVKGRLYSLLIILLINSSVIRANEQEYQFLVGVEDINYFPLFDFSSSNATTPSFTRDLLSEFFESHQLRYRFVPLPIKRFDKWYIEQNIDFKFPDNFRWREDKYNQLNITFSDPVLRLEAGTYVLKKNENIQRDHVNSLITVLGFHPTLWLDRVIKQPSFLQEDHNPLGIVRHVLHGNADATNIDLNVINYYLRELKKEGQIVLAKNIPHQKFYYHLSSIKYPEIIELFNQFLIERADYVDALKKKYELVE